MSSTYCCASDLFEYDETKALNIRKFFSFYKDQFPLLMVIIGGHYGDTRFDCYDNLQVLRVHCYTSQARVVVDDSRLNPAARVGYITIPEDTNIKFRVVKGHTKLGNPQKLQEILKEHENPPILLQMACDPQYPIRVGTSRHAARDFGNIFIRERYKEHFFIMNCVDGVELNMNKLTCMACLSEDLEATPVTGFKYKSKADFDEFFRKLSEDVAGSDEVYDRTCGNDDFSEYSFDDMHRLLDVSENKTGTLADFTETVVSDEDEYEEMPPLPPPRDSPKDAVPERNIPNTKPATKHQSKPLIASKPKHPKSPKATETEKESKGGFGFFKKKNRREHDDVDGETKHKGKGDYGGIDRQIKKKNREDHDGTDREMKQKNRGNHGGIDKEVKQTTVETVNPTTSAHKARAVHPTSPTAPPKVPPHIKTPSQTSRPSNQWHGTTADTTSEYVTLVGDKSYQNTKIGRATVKPMPRVDVSEDDKDDLKKQIGDEEWEQGDYESIEEVSTAKESSLESKNVRKKENPLLNELQRKIIGHGHSEQDTVEEEYEDMELGKGTNQETDDYLEPTTAVSQSSPPAYKGNDSSRLGVNQPQKREEKKQSVVTEKQDTAVETFSASTLSIKEVGEKLTELKLGKYVEMFEDNQIDGEILTSLSIEDFVNELGLKKIEAVRLQKYAASGHIPR